MINEIKEYKFSIGDEVINTYGQKGKIIDICTCSACFSRGFYEPKWAPDDDERGYQYITIYDAEMDFRDYYKIGKYYFNSFDRMGVIHEIRDLKTKIKRLESQLRFMEEEMEVKDWKEGDLL